MARIWIYPTKQGDTWDVIALDLYGTEMFSWWLQQANPEHLDKFFFPSGIMLVIPELPPGATAEPVPPWER